MYSSWPLGAILNPGVSHRGLASGLEGLHQPYNWLFIGLDVISSLLISLVCWLVWRRLRDSRPRKLLKIILLNVVFFAVGTIVDTLLPLHCEPTLQRCPSFTQDHILLAHGIFSIAAAIGLFASLAVLWWQRRRHPLLNAMMSGYLLFSLFSLIAILYPGLGNSSQHYYLTLCGVWLALLPYAIHEYLPLA